MANFWDISEAVLLENSSRPFFKSLFNFLNLFKLRQKKQVVHDETKNGKGNWQARLRCKTLTAQYFSVVRACSRIAAITIFTGSGIFIWVNIMTWLTFWPNVTYSIRFQSKFEWMSFPVKRPGWRPRIEKNWIGTHDF